MTTLQLQAKVGICRAKFVDSALYARFRLVLRALFGAFVLTLAFPSTAPAAIKTGVTVLVHGFVSLEGETGTTPFEYWGGPGNLRELLERFGSGKVWEYDPDSGDYVDITDRIFAKPTAEQRQCRTDVRAIQSVARKAGEATRQISASKAWKSTLLQFSKKLGISDSTLHRMEMGEQNVTLKTLEQIVDRLRCEVSDIFHR